METDVDGVPFQGANSSESADRRTAMELTEKVEDFEMHHLSKRERRIGCSNVYHDARPPTPHIAFRDP